MPNEPIEETVNEPIKDPAVITKLLDIYRTDKLCPSCKKGIETDREVVCRLCDIKKNARAQLDFIETGTMYLAHTLGIRKPPKTHVIKPAPEKPKKSTRKAAKKRTRKTTTKPKGKRG